MGVNQLSEDYYRECTKALNHFIENMEKLPPVMEHPGIRGAMEPFCNLLRIAKVGMNLHIDQKRPVNTIDGDIYHTFYENGDADLSDCISINRTTGESNQVVCQVFRNAAAPIWTDEERAQVNTFATLLFTFISRTRVMILVNRLMNYDRDLGIYNMNHFMNTLGRLFAQNNAIGWGTGRFNLRSFATVNQRIGRDEATKVMSRFANGIADMLSEPECICRIGGDNFLILFKKDKLNKIINYLEGTKVPTDVKRPTEITVSAWAGYYIIADDCKGPDNVMDSLLIAHANIRRAMGATYTIYNDNIRKLNDNKKWVEGHFESALDNEEFLVYYQPKTNLEDYTLSGAEALCRWKHGDELIPPMHFIPVLEHSDNICELDFYMLEHVCRDIRGWLDAGKKVVTISINMSRVNLGDENLSKHIIEILEKYSIPKNLIEIELTETTTDVDFTNLKKVVSALHDVGILTSVDDFGVGYSSLNLLREFPWNVLKIDRSFLPDDTDSDREHKIIMLNSVISLAGRLGIECIVEGVETLEQVKLLKDNGCFRAQGFYFDKPLPKEEFEKRLADEWKYSD